MDEPETCPAVQGNGQICGKPAVTPEGTCKIAAHVRQARSGTPASPSPSTQRGGTSTPLRETTGIGTPTRRTSTNNTRHYLEAHAKNPAFQNSRLATPEASTNTRRIDPRLTPPPTRATPRFFRQPTSRQPSPAVSTLSEHPNINPRINRLISGLEEIRSHNDIPEEDGVTEMLYDSVLESMERLLSRLHEERE